MALNYHFRIPFGTSGSGGMSEPEFLEFLEFSELSCGCIGRGRYGRLLSQRGYWEAETFDQCGTQGLIDLVMLM